MNSSTIKKRLIPVAILVAAGVAASLILNNPPQAGRRGPSKAPQMTVQTQSVAPQLYQVQLDSFGTVRPRTESVLVAQASGQITFLSDNFRDGGFFERGEVLIELDNRDHLADVKIAKANLLDAKQQLAEEQARAEQALIDWQRLGKQGLPNDLVLRKPQLEAAKAKQLSAEAQLAKAELALERTKIVAPYAGRVLEKHVDLGQVVSSNSQLADIYAVDYVEIRLPIKNNDLALIDLPEEFRGQQDKQKVGTKVTFQSAINQAGWQGQLVRTEGAINEQSQQLYVVAQIADPYDLANQGQTPVKIGQYVSAKINGKLLTDALLIPTQAIYQGSYVYIVEEGVLLRKEIELLWKNANEAVVKSGLNPGDMLVTTALGQVSSGTPVAIRGDTQRQAKSENKRSSQLAKEQDAHSDTPAKTNNKRPQADAGGQL
jgi:RND family efflux transporter MFP subunit